VDPRSDVIFPLDGNGINSGVFFMQNTNWTRLFLAEAWTYPKVKDSFRFFEQSAFIEIVDRRGGTGTRNHVKLEPQRWYNSYEKEQPVETMFVVHFPGKANKWDKVSHFMQRRRNID
jgi:hypothetical protein